MALKDALARNGIQSTDTDNGSPGNDGGQNGGGTNDGQEGDQGGASASGGAAAGSTSSTSTNTPAAIDDATLIATLKERGLNVNDFEELRTRFTPAAPAEPTAQEKQEAENRRKAEARAFALRNNIVTTNTLDDFARESSMPYTDLGYQLWKQERTEGLTAEQVAELNEQELVDEYHDEHSLYAEANDPKRIRKEKQLQSRVNAYLKEKYGKVYELESEYDSHIADQQVRTTYNTNVSEAVKTIGNVLNFSIEENGQNVPFSFQLPEGAIQAATEEFLSEASYSVFGKPNKLDQAAITNMIKANLKSKYLDQIISYVASTHAKNEVLKAAKGRRGIPQEELGSNQQQQQNAGKTTNSIMKRHLDEHSKQTGFKRQTATA